MVIATGRPSGMAATARATATRNTVISGVPWSSCATAMTAISTMVTMPRRRLKRSRRRISGGGEDGPVASASAMRPISVRRPVATTTPWARPFRIVHPACSMLARSATGVRVSWTASGCLATGSDSPVSSDSSTVNSWCSISRRSAPIRSPDSSRRMSPGTSSAASTSTQWPWRRTIARSRISASSASASFCAFHSWATPITALSWSTTKMKPASSHSPTATDTTVAASRR